jgi:hypothetical protein
VSKPVRLLLGGVLLIAGACAYIGDAYRWMFGLNAAGGALLGSLAWGTKKAAPPPKG